MFDKDFLNELKGKKRAWEETTLKGALEKSGERQKEYKTDSQVPVRRLYTPLDLEEVNFDYFKDIAFPGQYPFVRGLDPLVYRGNFWVMMQYSGFASAEETNKRFKYVLSQGATSFSIALDLPTHKALDSDHPLAEGEVGLGGDLGQVPSSLLRRDIRDLGKPQEGSPRSVHDLAGESVALA